LARHDKPATLNWYRSILSSIGGTRIIGEFCKPNSRFLHLVANSAAAIGPAVTGAIVQAKGAFTSAFFLAVDIALLRALALAAFVTRA
jgi:hypothetical protein